MTARYKNDAGWSDKIDGWSDDKAGRGGVIQKGQNVSGRGNPESDKPLLEGVESLREGNDDNTTTVDADDAVEYNDIDENELLDKLLDESASSAMFEDDHQKLVRMFVRSLDDDHVRQEHFPRGTLYR